MREQRGILLIEDDPGDRALVGAYLDQTDYVLQTAEGGAQGLSLAPRRAGESGTGVKQGRCRCDRREGTAKDDLGEGSQVTRSLKSLPGIGPGSMG